jgi:Na+-translocating ferredoxin:NAD+ oxidoreductase RnfC subunit
MSGDETIVRVSATYHLTVQVGDRLRQGEKIQEAAPMDETAPVSGIVTSIRFDPGNHEFIIAIAPSHRNDSE